MKRTIALIIIVVLMASLLAACQPAEPEVQEIEKPQAVTPEEPEEPEEEPVPEEPVEVYAQALYDGVYVLYGTALRGDAFKVTDETEDCYVTELDGIPVLIEKKYVRLDSQEAASAWEGKTGAEVVIYPTAYLEGEGQIVPEGTIVKVEDEFSGIYYITYTDESGAEIKGYLSSDSDIKNTAEEKKKSEKKSSKSDSSSKGSSKPAEKKESAPEPEPIPKEDPKPSGDNESSGDADDINLDNISAAFTVDYGIVPLAGTYDVAEAGELEVTEEETLIVPAPAESDEGIEKPAGTEGMEEELEQEGFTEQNGTVFADGTEVYIGTTVKGDSYLLCDPDAALMAAPDDDVSIIFAENTGSVKRWALKFEGDADFEQWPAKALKDIYPFNNGLGRGKGIEIPEGSLLTVIGDTGRFFVMLTEDGKTVYLDKEGSEEALMLYDEAAIEAEKKAAEEAAKEDKKKDTKKDSKKSSGDSSKKEESKPKEEPKPEPKEDSGSGDSETTDPDDSSEYTAPIL